ncbi:MAG: endolytic transglycosylase MltG, partial [Desulfovibrionaceae bacterium]
MDRKRMLKRLAVITINLAILAGIVAGGMALWKRYAFLNIPPEDPGRNVTVIIEPGTPFAAVARDLQRRGLTRDPALLVTWAAEQGLASKVRAGEFVLNTGQTPPEILNTLTSSPGVMQRVQVREGLTLLDTAQAFEDAGLCTAEAFAAAARDPAILEQWSIPADSAEGYLFPETYLF